MNGILNIYKEKGFTSFDVVAKLRGILKIKKIGHTGTLDPDAEGVLPVCIGNATKLCDLLTDKQKTYEAGLLLGIKTDTQDTSGSVLEQNEVMVTEEAVRETILSFLGKQQQIPPMYSALKVNGQKLCDLARKGIEVERKSRDIEIFGLDIIKVDLPRIRFRIHCSKGTYIRTLCHDIGLVLGCGGCMESLVRIQSGDFKIEESRKLQEIEDIVKYQAGGTVIEDILIPVDRVLSGYPAVHAVPGMEKLLLNGNRMPESAVSFQQEDQIKEGQLVRMYDMEQVFFGLYRKVESSFKVEKMFL